MKDQIQWRERLGILASALENDRDPVLSCEECQACLPAYVEAELEEEKLTARFPAVWRHLLLCDECGALYADMLEISMLEEAGRLPVPAAIPAPDLSFLPSPTAAMRKWVREIATLIVAHRIPESVAEFSPLCEAFFERVEALGEAFQIHSTSELALAFGAEVSPTLTILAATFDTTKAILDMLDTAEGQPEYSATQLADLFKRTAHKEARRLGLSRSQANTFAADYLRAARDYLPLLVDSADD